MRSLADLKSFLPGVARRATGLALGAVASVALAAGAFAAPAKAEPAIWVVKDADSTIYLFGTVHVLKPDAQWMSPKIKKAFDESQDLTLEIANVDDQQAAAASIMKWGLDMAHPLSTKLSDADKAKLAAAEAAYGIPAANLEPVKPWFAGLTFTLLPLQKVGFDAKSGVELNLLSMARARQESILGFETFDDQMGYFDGMPLEQQAAFLREAIDNGPKAADELDKLEKAWEVGDVDTISHLLNDDMKKEDPKLYDLLLTKRNERFAAKIAEKLKGKGVSFVAVGAAHLAGPDSVQAQLAKMGIQAKRL
ncbi:MAG: TraB/GumN family protein [Proteobacteria bacterium]|nr:TraB/GumN family protein [Pseudomonadota bacterium]